ncbi:MAG: hypothetical protein NWE95_03790 [Candidatus Bathyarchaeota archaeon]|nr:hypothetical protein [Candidatus Bathyarchaeota archaeon]
MPTFSTAQRLKIALGGFLAFTGFVILLTAVLAIVGNVNVGQVFQDGMIFWIVAFLSCLDIACGFYLLRGKKSLFATQQKKTNDNID